MSDEGRRARAQLSADDAAGIGTTIVGGQPPGAPRRPLRAVPVGIEKLLYAAAIEPAFREALLRDREEAIRARGIALEGTELAMLHLAPEAQLAAAIDGIDTSEQNLARRGFLHAVAGAVTLAAGTMLTGCDGDPPKPEFPYAGQPDRGDRDWFTGREVAGMTDLGTREGLKAGIDPGYPPRDVAGMTDRPWREAGPRDAGPPDKKTEK